MRPALSLAPTRIFAALAILSFAVLGGPSGHATGAGPQITHFTLDNGLDVVVIPDRRTPVVTHMIWYRVGAADETPGKSGLAHFLEHLLFKGTKKNPQGLFSQTVATIGGSENAFTSSDYTGYFQRTTRDRLKLMMEFESDRMTGLVLTDEVVKPELQVVLEERNSRVENNVSARLSEQMEAALFLNHPYGRPVIGWRHEIEQLTRDDAIAFYRRFYTPNNAILIVAGDVTADEVRELATATYGQVPRVAEVAPRQRAQEPRQEAPRTVTLADPRVTQPSLSRYYLAASYSSGRPGEAEAIDVLAHVLGRGANSRLYQRLVVESGIAVSAGASYYGTALDATRLAVYATPKNGVSLSQIEAATDAVIAELIDNTITQEELERARNRLIADAVYAQDSQSSLARWYGASLTTGLTLEQIRTWPDRLRAVTAEDVRNAARQVLDKRRSVTGYLIKQDGSKDDRS
ncbi:MAG: insulinase family protein [Hyphomicrobiales bacterium]|nr:insulinase family protein [Hyphomicrobiales bacterium]